MKFIIKQEKLIDCLKKIQPAVQTKLGSMPILQNFLIDVSNSGIKFAATDLEIGIKHTFNDVNSFTPITLGSATIPFKRFYEIVSTIDPSRDITVSYEDEKIIVTGDKLKMKISTLPPTDFPSIPSASDKDSFKVNAYDIVEMIEKTIFSSSQDDTNTVLNGLLWKKEKDTFTIASTDGRRLAVINRKLKESSKKEFKVVIPSRILEEVSSFIKGNCGEKDELSVSILTNQVSFVIKDTEFMSRFIEGSFPSYESIIPKSFESVARIDPKKLELSTKRAVIAYGDSKNAFVKYIFKKDVLTVKTSVQNVDFEDQIDCEFETRNDSDFSIVYNPKFILDILKYNNSKNLEFKFTGSTTPTMIQVEGVPDLIYMVMPLKSY